MAAVAPANRNGKLTEDQQLAIRRDLMRRRTILVVAPFVLLVLVVAFAPSAGLAPVMTGVFVSTPLILFFLALVFVRSAFGPLLDDVDAGVVETLTGTVEGGQLNGRRLRIMVPGTDALRDATAPVRVYVLPKTNLVVAFEPA